MAESMYGWQLIDDDDPKAGWPEQVSLTVTLDDAPAVHQLTWFSECRAAGPADESTAYLLQGVVRFHGAAVERADGSAMSVAELVDDANRWWRAFNEGDARLSVQAQRAAGDEAKSWRPDWAGRSTTYVPGGQ